MRLWSDEHHRISRHNTFCFISSVNLTSTFVGDLSRLTRWVSLKRVRRPKLASHLQRGNLQVGPPCPFVAMAMQILMVLAAQRHREFVADLAPQGSRLREF